MAVHVHVHVSTGMNHERMRLLTSIPQVHVRNWTLVKLADKKRTHLQKLNSVQKSGEHQVKTAKQVHIMKDVKVAVQKIRETMCSMWARG